MTDQKRVHKLAQAVFLSGWKFKELQADGPRTNGSDDRGFDPDRRLTVGRLQQQLQECPF